MEGVVTDGSAVEMVEVVAVEPVVKPVVEPVVEPVIEPVVDLALPVVAADPDASIGNVCANETGATKLTHSATTIGNWCVPCRTQTAKRFSLLIIITMLFISK